MDMENRTKIKTIVCFGLIFLFIFFAFRLMKCNKCKLKEKLLLPSSTKDPILCILKWGIGNRLKCLSSCLILSKVTQRPLYVYWTQHDIGDTKITDLFEGPFDFTLITDETVSTLPSELQQMLPKTNDYLNAVWGGNKLFDWQHQTTQYLNSGLVDLGLDKINMPGFLILNTWWVFKHPNMSVTEFLKLRREILLKTLKPSNEVSRFVNKYSSNINNNTLGIHIRTTDSCKVFWKTQENCDKLVDEFEKYIDTKLIQNKNTTIMLCADSKDVKERFKSKYKNKVYIPDSSSDRFSILGQQQAFAELITLSKCKQLCVTMKSTFAGEVIAMSDSTDSVVVSPGGIEPCYGLIQWFDKDKKIVDIVLITDMTTPTGHSDIMEILNDIDKYVTGIRKILIVNVMYDGKDDQNMIITDRKVTSSYSSKYQVEIKDVHVPLRDIKYTEQVIKGIRCQWPNMTDAPYAFCLRRNERIKGTVNVNDLFTGKYILWFRKKWEDHPNDINKRSAGELFGNTGNYNYNVFPGYIISRQTVIDFVKFINDRTNKDIYMFFKGTREGIDEVHLLGTFITQKYKNTNNSEKNNYDIFESENEDEKDKYYFSTIGSDYITSPWLVTTRTNKDFLSYI